MRFATEYLGRPWTHELPLHQVASQAYDEFGRLWRKVDAKGQTNEWLYDSSGRLATNQCYAPGSAQPSEIFSYLLPIYFLS